ncbi:putative MFS family arabinose efflux permease [Streptomyces sp. LBL]|uniref:MFS transporter n=1 Tax=Streptomyces sp. LBL TaxID=2940562 RepID=UPI002475E177|nr:MFS transporter [Streptomyces sp. LBL]MDH6625977.1 putative MFS family arabinose efflux permease [Streptomyces sp. LBL]
MAARSTRTATLPEFPAARRDGQDVPGGAGMLVLASSVVVLFLACANAPSPLYQTYESAWHASALTGTIAFATYAVAVIGGLLWLDRLPERFGRRAVLLTSIGGQVIALGMFTLAGSFVPIFIGRAVQGLASGATFGTLSALMIESDGERGPIASAASPGTGSGIGALLSGVLIQFVPGPTRTIYLTLGSVLLVQGVLVWRLLPDTGRPAIPVLSLKPRVAVPAHARAAFLGCAPVVFAVWGLSGFYAALSPALFRTLAPGASGWQSALPLFTLLGTATVTTVALRHVSGRAVTIVGLLMTLAGLGVTVAVLALGSVGLYLAASAIVGMGYGPGFQGPLRMVTATASDRERPALIAAVFVVAYLGLGAAAIVPGALTSEGIPLTRVAAGLAMVLATLSAAALVAIVRAPGRVDSDAD